jgi:FeS assembly SUF system protein
MDGNDPKALETEIIKVLRSCYDPEIPVNIYDLGLIYGLEVRPAGSIKITMTLTAPSCPVAGSLPGEVQSRVERVPGVSEVEIDLTWDPPWTMDKMSDAAKLQLGIDPLGGSARIARF